MFNSIAPKYDMLNHLFSINIDKIWRKKAVNMLYTGLSYEKKAEDEKKILDIACGTGDSTIALYKKGFSVTGMDIAESMMEIARRKSLSVKKKGVRSIKYTAGSAEDIPFSDISFDAVFIAFGIRNFNHREQCLKEIYRVIKPGGMLVIIELAKPENRMLKYLFDIYFNKFMARAGDMISGGKGAYEYLTRSVEQFPKFGRFCEELSSSGFSEVRYKKLSLGIAAIYSGRKAGGGV